MNFAEKCKSGCTDALANCVTLKLTVGDPSASHSERWNLEISEDGTGKTVVRHSDRDFGEPGSKEYALVKGKSYTFRLRWIATNLGYNPDFDWRFLVNDSNLAGTRPGLYGTGMVIIEDPDRLLTEETHGDATDITLGREGRILVPKVEFIEDPNQNFGFDPSGPWVSIARSGVTTVKAVITPESITSKIGFIRALRRNAEKLPENQVTKSDLTV